MLNSFEGYWWCNHLAYHILDFVQWKKIKFTMEQNYLLPILYCQYHSSWCPKDIRSQGISRHGIAQVNQNIMSLASEELIVMHPWFRWWLCAKKVTSHYLVQGWQSLNVYELSRLSELAKTTVEDDLHPVYEFNKMYFLVIFLNTTGIEQLKIISNYL